MEDRLGRKIEYLRISVTRDCNLNCIYCKPTGTAGSMAEKSMGEECNSLTVSEIEQVVSVLARLGIKKVRVTGGEPLIRTDIVEIVQSISRFPGIEDLSMTTNGIMLEALAQDLKSAGLKRINISLDSLKPEKFSYLTGGGLLGKVLKGIDKALEAGLTPIRLNTVLIRGVNNDEIENLMLLSKDLPIEVRFIELMPVGSYGEMNLDKIIYNSEILREYPELIPCEGEPSGQPAQYYRKEGFAGRIGFISPMSHKFCSSCNRIRLTCDRKLRPCLGNNGEVDLTGALKEGVVSLEELIRATIINKPAGHNFDENFHSGRNMSAIGG